MPTPPRRGAIIVVLLVGALACRHPEESTEGGSRVCAGPPYHQFDFFRGDWDTYDTHGPDTIIARNRVTSMLGGCAVRERYEQRDGHVGESFSLYDASRGLWHQSWVTNRGELLLLDGSLRGDSMVLVGTDRGARGEPRLVRGVWYPESTSVREIADRSTDSGRTWTPWFDITFRPHRR